VIREKQQTTANGHFSVAIVRDTVIWNMVTSKIENGVCICCCRQGGYSCGDVAVCVCNVDVPKRLSRSSCDLHQIVASHFRADSPSLASNGRGIFKRWKIWPWAALWWMTQGCRRKWNGGCFCAGNEMRGVFCKKKKVDVTPQNETKLNQTLLFILHFTYLGGEVRMHPTHPPLAYGHVTASGRIRPINRD